MPEWRPDETVRGLPTPDEMADVDSVDLERHPNSAGRLDVAADERGRPDNPRVALVSLHFAEYATNLALALARRRDVLLVLYQDNADRELGVSWRDRVQHSSLVLLVLERPKSPASVIANTWRLATTIRQFAPGLIHYQEDPRDEIILALPFLRGTPTVLTIHDPSNHSGTDSDEFRYSRLSLYRSVLRKVADVVITHGSTLVHDLVSKYPRFESRVRAVPHGALGVSAGGYGMSRPHGCRLLFFGRMNEYKGLRYFVEAVVALRGKGYPVVGVVAGRGPDLERHRRDMDRAGCFEVLDRYIPAEDVPRLFRDALAVVLPYTDATQSGVAAMALGYGRPVIASTVGSIPELVRNGRNGLLVPPCDAMALVNAIELLINDSQLWATLAEQAVRLRDGELSWIAIADETIRAYESLVEAV